MPIDLKTRGLTKTPKIADGDGALGFWEALRKLFSETREQRCWVHKTASVLNKMPESVHPKAKGDLDEILQAENKAGADSHKYFPKKVPCKVLRGRRLPQERLRRAASLL